METNKFEKHIAKKMKEREIPPPTDAWEKISARLELSETPKKKGHFWFAFAASIIGLLIMSIVFFDQESTPGEPEIADTPKAKEENTLKKDFPSDGSLDKVEIAVETETVNTSKKENLEATPVEVKEVAIDETRKSSSTAPNNLNDGTLVDKSTEGLLVPDTVVAAKITELLAKVEILEANSTSLTDAEVDSLLRKAQREIVTQGIIGDSGAVNAMALLSEVEEELDQSFRDQIFDKLKSGFLKVRTAVADRNN